MHVVHFIHPQYHIEPTVNGGIGIIVIPPLQLFYSNPGSRTCKYTTLLVQVFEGPSVVFLCFVCVSSLLWVALPPHFFRGLGAEFFSLLWLF